MFVLNKIPLIHTTIGYRVIVQYFEDIELKDSIVYIVYKGDTLTIENTVYVGYSGNFNRDNVFQCRACKHKNDLLSMVLNEEYNIFICSNLTKEEAHVLEAFLIREIGKPLTKPGVFELQDGYLINKARERR